MRITKERCQRCGGNVYVDEYSGEAACLWCARPCATTGKTFHLLWCIEKPRYQVKFKLPRFIQLEDKLDS